MELPTVTHDDDARHGAFAFDVEGKRLAKMTYVHAGDHKIIIEHTEVDDALRGTGAGKKLLMALVQWARETSTKVVPLCPFAKSVFEKAPEIQDVLANAH